MTGVETMASSYLGDAVYIRHDGYNVWLTTTRPGGTRQTMVDGGIRHEIGLEPHVFRAMLDWVHAQEKEHNAIGFWTGKGSKGGGTTLG